MKSTTKKENKMTLRMTLILMVLSLLVLSLMVTACGSGKTESPESDPPVETGGPTGSETDETEAETEERVKAYDFTLTDQYGVEHQLSDYEGQVIFLNFWATWCPPCKEEMPDIEQLYRDHEMNSKDLVILAVAYPDEDGSVSAQREMDTEGIKQFLIDNNYSFPVLMDVRGEAFNQYQISGLPTTYMIDHEGYFIGYVQGALPRELMDHFVNDALNAMGH
jgi:cytochrome c-type biogenesis protein